MQFNHTSISLSYPYFQAIWRAENEAGEISQLIICFKIILLVRFLDFVLMVLFIPPYYTVILHYCFLISFTFLDSYSFHRPTIVSFRVGIDSPSAKAAKACYLMTDRTVGSNFEVGITIPHFLSKLAALSNITQRSTISHIESLDQPTSYTGLTCPRSTSVQSLYQVFTACNYSAIFTLS